LKQKNRGSHGGDLKEKSRLDRMHGIIDDNLEIKETTRDNYIEIMKTKEFFIDRVVNKNF
jgi:hypothetical protein